MANVDPARAGRRRTASGVAVVAILAAAAVLYLKFSNVSAADAARSQVFVDQNTGKPFTVAISPGMAVPCKAPSGGMTGYPADFCYWTADGQVRSTPYPLVTNERLGKAEPTFCPDCGRLFRPNVNAPQPGDAPPPKAGEEYDRYMDDLRKQGLVVNPS